MRKLGVLALKEVRVAFRDLGAIVTMLVTPLALTLAMAAAFGTGGAATISDIPVLLLNRDRGVLSETLIDILQSEEVGDLLIVEDVSDEAAARSRIEADEAAALVIIPANFSAAAFPLSAQVESITGLRLTEFTEETQLSDEEITAIASAYQRSQETSDPEERVIVEIYASPDRLISTAVVKGIVTQGIETLNIQIAGITEITSRLVSAGGMEDPSEVSGAMGGGGADIQDRDLPVHLDVTTSTGRRIGTLDYTAASIAVMFLMFSVTSGGRSLLAERAGGTLPRLLVSPTTPLTLLIGKMAGIVLTGTLQVVILWGATSIFGAYWGPPPLVFGVIVAVVICASGVGALISAWARTPGQAGALGTGLTLVASILSGSFFARYGLPQWIQTLSLVTPNAWAIEIFTRLQTGQGFSAILPWLGGMILLTVAYYTGAAFGFRRQFD
jgi:ABC-2 type transport system permease protein